MTLHLGLSAVRCSQEQRSLQLAPLPFQGRHSSMAWTPTDCPKGEAYPTSCTPRGSDGITGEETVIKKCLFLWKTGILKALAKDTGRRFSSPGLRELFLLGGATAACRAWLGWKKKPLRQGTAVSKHSSGLGAEGGFNYVCMCVLFKGHPA